MAFDVDGARKAGYSDAEIADHLASTSGFDAPAARKAGYDDAELIGHLSAAAPSPSATPGPTAAPGEAVASGTAPQTIEVRPSVPFDPNALNRTIEAGRAGWEAGSHPLTPEAEAAVERMGPLGHYLINPLARLVTGVPAAVVRGGQQAVMDTINQNVPAFVGPGLGRDIAAFPEAFPTAGVFGPRPPSAPPRAAPGPRFVQELGGERMWPLGPEEPARVAPLGPEEPVPPPAWAPPELPRPPPEGTPAAPRPPPEPAPPQAATAPGPRPDVFVPPRDQIVPPGEMGARPRPSEPAVAPPAAPVAPRVSAPPTTAAEAKAVASTFYDIHEKAGGAEFPASFADDVIGAVKKIAPQTEAGRIVTGETAVTKLVERIEELRDKRITLKSAQEIDEGIGDLIDREYTLRGVSKDGRALIDLQDKFRDLVETSAPEGEAAGGIDALRQGQRSWAQAQKMSDIERIWRRAELTDYPSTGFRRGIRDLLANDKRSRGYSPAEKTELRRAARRGAIGGTLHVFGSRLLPLGATIAGGSAGGFLGGAAAAAATHAGTSAIRGMATALQQRRMQRALNVLGQGVPPMPSVNPMARPPTPPPAPPPRPNAFAPPAPRPPPAPAAAAPPTPPPTPSAAPVAATARTAAQIQREEGVGINEAVRRQQAEAPAAAAPPEPAAAAPHAGAGGIEALDPADIGVDAARFQFKAGGDEAGVTERLQDVQKWDPRLAGTALVFRDEAGKNWIADGHQRVALAKRLSAGGQSDIRINSFVLDATDGVTEADARAIAAVKNIAEGTGTSIDAAKVLREAARTGIDLPPMPPRSALVREGQSLAKLGPDAFGMAINNVVPTPQAALVGRIIADEATQTEAMGVLAKAKPENLRQAEMMVREVLETGTETQTRQGGLFGEESFASSVVLERAKIADEALKQLGRDKTTFRTLVGEADRVEGHGANVLDRQSNQSRLTADEQASQFLTQLATRKGPVSDALSDIARRLKSGELGTAAAGREFLDVVRRSMAAGLVEGADVGGAVAGAEQPGLGFPPNKLAPPS